MKKIPIKFEVKDAPVFSYVIFRSGTLNVVMNANGIEIELVFQFVDKFTIENESIYFMRPNHPVFAENGIFWELEFIKEDGSFKNLRKFLIMDSENCLTVIAKKYFQIDR